MKRCAKLTSAAAGIVLATGTLAGGATFANAASDKAEDCTVQRLEIPSSWDMAVVNSGDPTGRYIIGSGGAKGDFGSSLLWTDGEPQRLPDYGAWDYATAVDASGTVVGHSDFDTIPFQRAWRYRDGEYELLPKPNDTFYEMVPSAMNTQGDTVGWGVSDDTGYVGLYWPADQPDTVQILKRHGYMAANNISDQGVITGYDHASPKTDQGFVWTDPDAAPDRLLGSHGGRGTYPTDIAGDLVVGADDQSDSAIWDLKTGEVTHSADPAVAVNNDGDIAYKTGPNGKHAVIVHADGTEVELPSPTDKSFWLDVLFDRGGDLTAAGTTDDYAPYVWRGC